MEGDTRGLHLHPDLRNLSLQLGEGLLALGRHTQLQHVHLVLHVLEHPCALCALAPIRNQDEDDEDDQDKDANADGDEDGLGEGGLQLVVVQLAHSET